jgi:hypothetical protein
MWRNCLRQLTPRLRMRCREWNGHSMVVYGWRDGASFCTEYTAYALHGRVLDSHAESESAGQHSEYLNPNSHP